MDEAEARRVQANAPERIAPAPARLVADDRMSEGGELSTDLAPSPGHERELEQRRPREAPQTPVTGDRSRSAPPGPTAKGPVPPWGAGQVPSLLPAAAFHAA